VTPEAFYLCLETQTSEPVSPLRHTHCSRAYMYWALNLVTYYWELFWYVIWDGTDYWLILSLS